MAEANQGKATSGGWYAHYVLAVLVIVFLSPVNPFEAETVEEVPERLAKLIVAKPKPPAPPAVLHHGTPNSGEPLVPGMTFTVEPMINLGHWKTEILDDGWTAVTVDGTLSAQFEHTLLVTDDGFEVLTLSKEGTFLA